MFPVFVAAHLAVIPGSEKIRRIVEVLRADVIQGLGIQLLEQVYDLLEEEDELERGKGLRLCQAACVIDF